MHGSEPPDLKTTRLYLILFVISIVFIYGARLALDIRDRRAPANIKAHLEP